MATRGVAEEEEEERLLGGASFADFKEARC